MDLRPTPGRSGIPRRVPASWLQANLPWEYGKGLPPASTTSPTRWPSSAGGRPSWPAGRWVGVAWPEAYGGRGGRPGRALHRAGGAGPGPGPGAGRPHRHQPGRARRCWPTAPTSRRRAGCRASSRPTSCGASCSASPARAATWPRCATRATPVDGGWLLNGQKVWTSYAQFADWGVCLARTDPDAPKHQGISYLVVDMHAPGVEVRPLVQLTGEAEFNEVFLNDVFVPDDQLIGPAHEGWRVANSTLSHERGTNPRQLVIHIQLLEELLRLAVGQRRLRRRPRCASGWPRPTSRCACSSCTTGAACPGSPTGRSPGRRAAASSCTGARCPSACTTPPWPCSARPPRSGRAPTDNPGDGRWQRSWLYYQAASIWAGTNEIQRNIIGERVLGPARGTERQRGRRTDGRATSRCGTRWTARWPPSP